MSGGVLIAGGGTGGHIYPAIAIAQAIKKMAPTMSVDFVGTRKGLETKIVPRENFPLHFVDVGALNGVGLITKILTFFSLPLAIFQGVKLVLRLRPRAVIGVGGYASGPVMLAAALVSPFIKIQRAIFEPNAYPGLTNRWLARWVNKAFTNFEVSKKFFKDPEVVGIPIRDGLRSAGRQPAKNLRMLIFGGSQGARGINTVVFEAIKKGGGWLDGVEIVHQIGSADFNKFNTAYGALSSLAEVATGTEAGRGLGIVGAVPKPLQWFEFLYDMPERYQWADVVVCRAGASTLAELAACGKAAVLIPFPFAADNHQQENADALRAKGAAVMILQKDFTVDEFIRIVEKFKKDRGQLAVYEKAVTQFYRPQSAEKIAAWAAGLEPRA